MRALPLALVCGCFGAGPEPTEATEAEILFSLPLGPIVESNCQPRPYVGGVALGDTHGFVITHTYLPACEGGNQGPNNQLPVVVFEFPKIKGPPRALDNMAGSIGIGGGGKPRIAAFGAEAVWAFTPMEGSTQTELRSRSNSITGLFSSTTRGASGLVLDATHTYIGGTEDSFGNTQINDPRYPCCGSGGGNPQPTPSTFVQVTNTTNTTPSSFTAPDFNAEHVKDCLVGNSTALFSLERSGQAMTSVARRPKATPDAPTQLGQISVGRPGGLAANETHVAWSITRDYVQPEDPDRCAIFVIAADGAMGAEQEVFATNRFSCLDVALDATHVYFTILALSQFEDQSDGLLRHVGIGRVPLAGGMPEILDLGIIGPHAAPRGVFVDGDDLILVAPFAVAKLRKDALAGRTDVPL
jgi:hypothetical protein